MVRILLLFFLLVQGIEATKRFSRATGMKCLKCHQSRKGGGKNLKRKGKEYRDYRSIKNELRRSRLLPKEKNARKAAEKAGFHYSLWEFWYGLEIQVRKKRIKKARIGKKKSQ